MITCRICDHAIRLDDLVGDAGGGICLGCESHRAGSARPMPASLRREVTAALTAAPQPHSPAWWTSSDRLDGAGL